MKPPSGGTNDPRLRSWVESANREDGDFPIQNLPFGVFREREQGGEPRLGVAIGDRILDLRRCREAGLLRGLPPEVVEACGASILNPLMALGPGPVSSLRGRLSDLLRAEAEGPARDEGLLVRAEEAELLVPAAIGDYTDFYASIYHAQNVGRLFRPDHPLLPNYRHLPIAYHGRSSSIVVSGTPVRRPLGQRKDPEAELPSFEPSRFLDCELEMGFLVGRGNHLGQRVPLDRAEEHLFGCVLVNDWSARDIQSWEYQPLGPFLSKNFTTSVSPWVVTLEALEPFRAPAFPRAANDPPLLPYLSSAENAERGGIDITVELLLQSAEMRRRNLAPMTLGRGSTRDLYWTPAQMLAHHTSNGCNLRPGDLLASGTVSGPTYGSEGCLLEMTRRGAKPVRLPSGEERGSLADGDEVILRAHCRREGFARVGWGECRGMVLPGAPEGSRS